MTSDEIFNEILKKINMILNKPVIIGINGVDTSGKTFFSENFVEYLLKKNLKVQLIKLDDFHNEKKIRSRDTDEIQSYINNAFNLDLLEKELLSPIRNKVTINKSLNLLNLQTDKLSETINYNIDIDTIVVIEGVLLFREPINDYFDLRIYLDIKFREVIKRSLTRDVPIYGKKFIEKYKKKYIPIQKIYIKKYKPKTLCDILIDNNDFNNPRMVKK